MTDGNMFCFQCEQTAGCTACTGAAGVCGKTADVARLQDELTGALIALARAENGGKGDSESDGLMLEGMFACVSNVSFDPEAIAALERRGRIRSVRHGRVVGRTGGYPQPEELTAFRHARRGGVCLPCAGVGEVGSGCDSVPV